MSFLLKSGVLILLVLVGHVVWLSHGQECKSEDSISDIILKGHAIKSFSKDDVMACWDMCSNDVRCQSINFFISQRLCEINNRTIEHAPEEAVKVPDTVYITNPLRGEFSDLFIGKKKQKKNNKKNK